MVAPLLESKMHVPRARGGALARHRLTQRLDAAADRAVTLVSAPAGFGKTTVLAAWLASAGPHRSPVAWVSLDARDNDSSSFWAYAVTALGRAAPHSFATTLAMLQGPSHAVVASLQNELERLDDDVLLVLDDYHLIHAQDVHDGIAALLEHPSPRFHLLLASRSDPPLPLAALRARGQLREVRAADLRFTAEEAGAYLNGPMGLSLTAPDVEALEQRTEGWVAALQLAALSLQGREDASRFIAGFAGDDRYVVDYLAEEVLNRQPSDIRDFLLETSVLERLSGPLCDAVTGRSDSQRTLVALERANLFLVPLDDRRRWWRYHHLFADVLRTHLADDRPDSRPELHRRASLWFEDEGSLAHAVSHAIAARDFPRAAGLMELAIPELSRQRREREFRDWVTGLPDEVVANRPVLGVALAGALAQVSQFDTVAHRLDVVERSAGVEPGGRWPDEVPEGLVVVDEEGYRQLPSRIAAYRAALALTRGDLAATAEHARRALACARPEHDLARAAAGALGGLASWTVGDLDGAETAYAAAMSGLLRAGFVSDTLGCSIALGDMLLARGRLTDALRTYQRGLEVAVPPPGVAALRGTPDMHVAIAGVLLERDDRTAAQEHLAISQSLGDHLALPQNPYRWRLVAARLREAEGDLDGALALVDEADRVYDGDYSPNVRPVPAVRARLLLRRGDLAGAHAWARAAGVSPEDDPVYLREFEHVTLARLLLAERDPSSPGAALGLLGRLRAAAEMGGRAGSLLEIHLLLAQAHVAAGDRPTALDHVREAVRLAEPEGHVRVFLDEGRPVRELLRVLDATPGAGSYVHRLAGGTGRSARAVAEQGLPAPLSTRELAVLRFLASDLSGPDIARELSVSLNTLRTHTKSIYAKLGVDSRRAAVTRAGELDLTAGPPGR